MSGNDRITGIRAEGEGDRPPEFKAAREQLVGTVNDWLVLLAAVRDAGETLADGREILDKPRLIQTMIGKTATGMHMMSEERKGGVSLVGDGIGTQLKLQVVQSHDTGSGVTIIEVTGSDPLDRQFHGGYSLDASRSTVAGFKMTDIAPDDNESYFGYEVKGSGAMRQMYVTDQGVHTTKSVRTPEDVQLAIDTFSIITSQLPLADRQ